jgi:hypothetical protein
MNQPTRRPSEASTAVPRNYNTNPVIPAEYQHVTPLSRVNITLSLLGAAMHEADLSLTRLSTSDDDRAALAASKARSLLTMCMDKFVDLMEVQS